MAGRQLYLLGTDSTPLPFFGVPVGYRRLFGSFGLWDSFVSVSGSVSAFVSASATVSSPHNYPYHALHHTICPSSSSSSRQNPLTNFLSTHSWQTVVVAWLVPSLLKPPSLGTNPHARHAAAVEPAPATAHHPAYTIHYTLSARPRCCSLGRAPLLSARPSVNSSAHAESLATIKT